MTDGPTADEVLKLHAKIRWAGLASELGEVIWVQQRQGLKSYSPEDADRAFVQMGPLIIGGVCERLSPWTGRVGNIVINYEKVTSLITKIKAGYLCMTIEKEEAQQSIQEIVKSLEKWMT